MAFTSIENLISNDAFTKYFVQAVKDRSALFKSGIAVADRAVQAKCNEAGFGGEFVSMPFFNALTSGSDREDEVLTEESNLTPQNITAGQDVAPICRRGKAFGSNDLAADVAGADPMKVIADQLADYWNTRNEARLLSVLKGVFAANVASNDSDLVLDISGGEGAAGILSKDSILLVAQMLGDRKTELTAVAMNSMVETFLAAMDTNAGLYRASDAAATLPKYNGRDIIVDDNCLYDPETKKVELYLFGRGAIAYNDCPVKVPFETARDALSAGGRECLVSRIANICHVRGVKWATTTANPTNTALETAANWSRVYDKKDIRVVKLVARIG